MGCETCLHERELDDIKKDIERNRDDKKDIYDRLNTLEQSSATTRTDLTYIKNGIDGLRTSVDELQKKPSKRWDLVITTIITAVVSSGLAGLIAFFAAGR